MSTGVSKPPKNPFGYALQGIPLPLIPESKTPNGPITKKLFFGRLLPVLAALFIIGNCVAWTQDNVHWRAFGLGLMYPGGGFLVHLTGSWWMIVLHIILFVLFVFLFVAGLAFWLLAGNFSAPIVVWLIALIWGSSMDHQAHHAMHGMVGTGWDGARWLVPVLWILTAAYLTFYIHRINTTMMSEGDRINAIIDGKSTAVSPLTEGGERRVQEMSPDTLKAQRYILDRALQPIDEYNGFDIIDEFREAARRYQISSMCYALSLQTYGATPAFRGYVAEANKKLGVKMQEYPVWKYWRIENLWGQGGLNPDPIIRDNIMYSGWYATMLGFISTVTDDPLFRPEGAIHLESPKGKTYTYGYDSLCDVLETNFTKSRTTLFPCEPGWIYPMCNNFGAIGLISHDRLYGSQHWERIAEQYRTNFDNEFVRRDGRITAVRESRTGLTAPFMTSTMADSIAGCWLNGVFPDIAQRSWEVVRNDIIFTNDEGKIDLKMNGWDLIDFGNYRKSAVSTFGVLAVFAGERGDFEVRDAMLQRLREEYPSEEKDGVSYRPGVSNGAQFIIYDALVSDTNLIHDLVQVGMPETWRNGPLLESADYPRTLVAKAVSDGKDLDMVLYPGTPNGGREKVGLSQLVPGTHYAVRGAVEDTIIPDASGCASLHVDLDGRTEVLVLPTSR